MDNLNKIIRECGMKIHVQKMKVMGISQKEKNQLKIYIDEQ